MKTRIHIDQHAIRANAKDGGNRPTITVKDYKRNRKCRSATVLGPSVIIDSAQMGLKPLSCGARVWIETLSEVEVLD